MATEKHKTILEIEVGDARVRGFGDLLRRVFSTEPIDRFRRAQAESTREMEKQARAAERAAAASQRSAGIGGAGRPRDARGRYTGGSGPGAGPRGAQGGAGPQQRQPLGFWGTAGATGVGFLGGQMVGRGIGAATGMAGGMGATRQALGALPIAGPILAAAMGAAEQLTDKAIAAGQARAMTAGRTGLGSVGGMGMSRYGVSRQQLPARLAMLAQQSGMRGAGLAELGPDALRMEALTGVSGGVMAGAAGAAGGKVDARSAMRLTEEAITAGLESGVREAKLGQFVQQMASDIEQMRNRGIMIDPQAVPSIVRMMARGGAGLQGMAGVGAARSMTQAVQGAGQRNDFYGALMMQTAMDKGMSAFEAQLALEENPEKFIPEILNRIGGMGGSNEAKAMALKQFLPQLSMRQAMSLAETGGRAGFREEELGTGRAKQFVKEQEAATRGAFGLAEQAAGLENQQIAGGGGAVAKGIMATRKREIKMAKRGAGLGTKAADFMSAGIERYSDALASENPMSAVMKTFASDMSGVFSAITDSIQSAVKDAFGMDMGQAGRELAGLSKEDVMGGLSEIMKDVVKLLREIKEAIASALSTLGFNVFSVPTASAPRQLRQGG